MEEYSEEIRQMCNKYGVPELFNEIATLLGLEEDYSTESESESSSSESDDDVVSELIKVKKNSDGLYELSDCQTPQNS
tara:strand:- start:362 stop:595 length:234 start_codon:yes stop_codon:yes gene_type:complete